MKIKFGTDGWRGVIAEEFTFENVRRVAQASADYWNATKLPKSAIVGYDNRFFSEVYAKLTCEVLAANGIKAIYPPESVPTPAISHAVRDRKLCGAVMLTASHNPPKFNGFKLKAHYAGSADPDLCRAVEAAVDQTPVRRVSFEEGVKAGTIEVYDPRPAHLRAVKQLVDLKKIRNSKLRVVVDSMHGSGNRDLATLLTGGRCRVTAIRTERDPYFGGVNPEPIGKNLKALCTAVKQARAHVGVATDGDADRMGVVDDKSRYVSIQLVFALQLLHLLRDRGAKKGVVVKSANGTVLIDRICKAYGLECVEVPVGFKYICEQMLTRDVLIGGEESGGMGFQGHVPERDGILANLMLLEALAESGKPISQAVANVQREFGKSAYDRNDIHYPLEKRDRFIEMLRNQPPEKVLGVPVAEVKTFDGVKYVMADDSWLMFRTSGTEPIIRIYAEAVSAARVKQLLEHGRRLSLKV